MSVSAQVTAGARFGRLTAIELVDVDRKYRSRWRCRCDCGAERVVWGQSLTSGNTRSCGCLHRERVSAASRRHGATGTAEYRIWSHMRRRCLSPDDERFASYGGRGITVCERWQDFENFLADMGQRPSPRHSIDRKNNDGNYEPGNCRWATPREQQRNRRVARRVVFRGETRLLVEWAELLGVKYATLDARLRRGWSVDRALGGGS